MHCDAVIASEHDDRGKPCAWAIGRLQSSKIDRQGFEAAKGAGWLGQCVLPV